MLPMGTRLRNPRRSLVSSPVSVPVLSYSPWSPMALQPSLWLDAADPSTMTVASGKVSEWRDKSGNGYTFTQGNSTLQPTLSSSILNGLPVVSFNGSNQVMTTTGWTVPINTIIGVIRSTASTGYSTFLGAKAVSGSTAEDAYYFQFVYQQPTAAFGTSSGSVLRAQLASVSVNQWIILDATTLVESTTRVTITRNGSTTATATTTSTPNSYSGNLAIGAGYYNRNIVDYIPSQFAELLLFKRVLNAGDLSNLRDYLNRKWAIY